MYMWCVAGPRLDDGSGSETKGRPVGEDWIYLGVAPRDSIALAGDVGG